MLRREKREKLLPSQEIKRRIPINITRNDVALFSHEYKKKFDECFCSFYKNITITARSSGTYKWHIIPEGFHTAEVSFLIKAKSICRSMIYRRYSVLDKAVLITDDYSNGYFHWIADVLPRILLIPDEWKDIVLLLPDACMLSYCKDTFMIFERKKKYFYIPQRKKVFVKNLCAIGNSVYPYGSGNYRPHLMKEMRRKAHAFLLKKSMVSLPFEVTERIYISRLDASYRYISNEEELYPLFRKYNFTIVTMSKLSFLQQVFLCSSIKILLSLHGAGLVNMMWMYAGGIVSEIRNRNDSHNNCYFSLASALDLHYFYSFADTHSKSTHTACFVWNKEEAEKHIRHLVAYSKEKR